MFKYSKQQLKKVEDLFAAVGYVLRYEKGNFQSGYCLVEARKVVVVNKFYDAEARINCLLDILSNIEVNIEQLSDETLNFYQKILKHNQSAVKITEPTLFENE